MLSRRLTSGLPRRLRSRLVRNQCIQRSSFSSVTSSSAHQLLQAQNAANVTSEELNAQSSHANQLGANLRLAKPVSEVDVEKWIKKKEPAQALRVFNRLAAPPSMMLSQKLAILLAKKASPMQAIKAFEILKKVLTSSSLTPDDYTKLALIYVVDACLRQKMLHQAFDLYEEAYNLGVSLDLPAYEFLIASLVEADRVEDARELLDDVWEGDEVTPSLECYVPILKGLMEENELARTIELLDHGRKRKIPFTLDVYRMLVEGTEDLEDSDELQDFTAYIDKALEEDQILDEMVELLEEEEGDDDDEDSTSDDDVDDDEDDFNHGR